MLTVVDVGRKRGLNLLEVMIATFVFSSVSIFFLGVWGQHVRANEKSRHYLVASHLAESLIEEKLSMGYGAVPADPTPEDRPFEMIIKNRGAEITVEYRATVLVTEIGAAEDRLKSVEVRVTWDDSTSTGEVFLETVLGSAN